MPEISEKEIIEDIKKEIGYSLDALVSRLRRTFPGNKMTSYIDEARINFENSLASAIAKTVMKVASGK